MLATNVADWIAKNVWRNELKGWITCWCVDDELFPAVFKVFPERIRKTNTNPAFFDLGFKLQTLCRGGTGFVPLFLVIL